MFFGHLSTISAIVSVTPAARTSRAELLLAC